MQPVRLEGVKVTLDVGPGHGKAPLAWRAIASPRDRHFTWRTLSE